jgi:hypothetical protein
MNEVLYVSQPQIAVVINTVYPIFLSRYTAAGLLAAGGLWFASCCSFVLVVYLYNTAWAIAGDSRGGSA